MADDLRERLEVVKELTNLFKFERMVYLVITLLSLIMLMSSAVSLMLKGHAGPAELTMLFGSSGSITYTAGRLLFMWNEALKRLIPSSEKEGQ
ncbi:MAG: hypothetical protein AMK74_06770 [Nitrospira bacterium SM23_35]|nr:MAG: hypothetical protein AMK74_06770 [Nitrospira bacterium SM23_35]